MRVPAHAAVCLALLALLALAAPVAGLAHGEVVGAAGPGTSGPGAVDPPGLPGQEQQEPAAPPPEVEEPLSLDEGLGLGPLELSPDVGFGVAIGVGLSLAALGLASLLGTRFVTSENVLENDARRAIFEYIKTNPGCHLRETASALQLSTTNVLWHLRKLEESNLVSSKKLEGYKVFYTVEGGVEARRMGLALAVLRNPNARQILGTIARSPGIHQREIARLLGVNHGTVRWHLKKLNIVQLVLEVKKGAVSQYFISALGLQALERVELRPAQTVQPPPLAEAAQPARAEA